MSPTNSRKRLPADWQAYDDASRLAIDLRNKARVIGKPLDDKWTRSNEAERDRAIELLDMLRGLLRERIEADAAEAGKVVAK